MKFYVEIVIFLCLNMGIMKEFELQNGIKSSYKQNKNTPRTALALNVAINEPEKIPGVYSLMNRLLLQGTKNRTSEQLANELEENAIELSCEMKQDFLSFHIVCLNEDFELAVELLEDVIKNSTFEEFEKERNKLEGEIPAELDSAKTRALDNYLKTIFKDHFYGNSHTKILENLPNIAKNDVIEAFDKIMTTGKKVFAFVGDKDFDYVKDILNKHFGNIKNNNIQKTLIITPTLAKKEIVEYIKHDSNQAQIFQGWLVPTFDSPEYTPFIVLNTLLGSSGLSSRLFCELRDKKGLAYTVRSSYERYRTCANFNIYIATEPKNIDVSLSGFMEEIQKIKDVLVGEQELTNAKNNYIGKQEFFSETNLRQAIAAAYFGIMGLGFDFKNTLIKKVKEVKAEELQEIARKYLNDVSVISILKP